MMKRSEIREEKYPRYLMTEFFISHASFRCYVCSVGSGLVVWDWIG